MIYEIKINTSIVDASINKALSRRFNCRGDFFHELRNTFRGHVEEILMISGISVISNGALSNTNYLKNGVQHKWAPFVKFTGWNNEIKQGMDMDFCARYGHDDYSMQALNYLNKEASHLPALFSMKYGLCHYCNGGIPKHIYGSSMYYSSFLQRYLPYHRLISRKKYGRMLLTEDLDYKAVENELRERFGFPKIGQKWLTEIALYKMIKLIFSDREVIHHYRGSELQGLELDIWIPSLRLGIEYQGIQHYKVVEHWGGQEGLDMRIANDKKKKKLCTELNYVLVEFNHTETLTEDFVRRRVAQFIIN